MDKKQRALLVMGCFLLCFGCSSEISKEELPQLNGYWEIEQVVFPDGNTKKYTVNTTVDYIQWEAPDGFRKKMSPKLDGTYETSDDAETFTISEKDGNFSLDYVTGMSQWSEKLVALDEDTFSVINQEGLQYDYRRFAPIAIGKED